MPSVTYDGRSFMLDGRRIWIVSGAIHYARVPAESWEARIHAAKMAGLNAVETPVFWNRHEARPGQFDFEGDNDLRRFVELVGEAGMWCILRPGPFVGSGWDFGGLPAWFLEGDTLQLRTNAGPFLEACSRYISAVAGQVKDLQVTSPGDGGPILLVQNESKWTCGDDALGQSYLGELNRYLREAGFTVPTINDNQLWQRMEGEIACWSGSSHMSSTMRQLAVVRPDDPRLVIEFNSAPPSVWGKPTPEPPAPAVVQRRMAEIMAVGGQININPFHGGTNFGFWGGRFNDGPDAFATASHDGACPVSEAGGQGATFGMVRRISTFASRFGRVLSNLDPTYQPVVIDPAAGDDPERKASAGPGLSVVHSTGTQGSIAWLFSATGAKAKAPGRSTTLLLPDGSHLHVELGDQAVGWCLFDVQLTGRHVLDYCTFNAFGAVGDTFVCYGPAGSTGMISINGSPAEIVAPKAKTPVTIEIEGITVVVCSEALIDRTYFGTDAVFVGVDSMDRAGKPVLGPTTKQYIKVRSNGKIETVRSGAGGGSRASARASFGTWSAASTADYVNGQSPRFASIAGPAELAALGTQSGYGWYRIKIKSSAASKPKTLVPESGDRLHLFVDAQAQEVIGIGPGATDNMTLNLTKGEQTLVILAENLGRYSEGTGLGDLKGLYGHLWEAKSFKAGRSQIEIGDPINALSFRSPLWGIHAADRLNPERLTWSFMHRRKSPIIMSIDAMPVRALVILNDVPVRFVERNGPECFIFDSEELRAGKNVLQVALLDGEDPSGLAASAINFFEGAKNLTEKADWAFAKWEAPAATAYKPVSKSGGAKTTGPTWWKAGFEVSDTSNPLFLDATGLTKGQLFLNGRHLSRYWVATSTGKQVPPQGSYYLPGPWLNEGKGNELVIFDEHGGNPTKCKLSFDRGSMPIGVD